MSKLTMLRGNTTPEVFCAKLMECADQIEHIATVVTFKKTGEAPRETMVFNTAMSNREMAWMRWCFDQDFRPDDG